MTFFKLGSLWVLLGSRGTGLKGTAIFMTSGCMQGNRPGACRAGTGVYSAATGWGSPPTLGGPPVHSALTPGSGFSRACRVSASATAALRSVGVFPAWGNQEETRWEKSVPERCSPIPVASSWEQLAMSEASLVMTTWGRGTSLAS